MHTKLLGGIQMKVIKEKETMTMVGAVIGTVGVIGGVISTICLKRKVRKLDEKINYVADCHNQFCKYQMENNLEFEEQIEANYQEIISNLEHIQCLAEKLD